MNLYFNLHLKALNRIDFTIKKLGFLYAIVTLKFNLKF